MRLFATTGAMLLATVCLSQAHAATSIVQGSSSVSNLSYALTDLKTTDWVAPSLKPVASNNPISLVLSQTAGRSIDYSPFASDYQSVVGTPFDASTGAAALSTGTAALSKQGNNFTGTLSVGSDTFNNLGNGDFLTGYRGNFTSANLKSSIDVSSLWVLSAYTQITITGQVAMNLQLDAASLAQVPAQFGSPDRGLALSSYLGLSLGLSDVAVAPGTVAATGSLAEFSSGASQTVSINGVEPVVMSTPSVNQTFSITLSNNTNKAMNIRFDLDMANGASWRSVPAPIPEPGTWALMALGLGLMGWRVRASQARPQA